MYNIIYILMFPKKYIGVCIWWTEEALDAFFFFRKGSHSYLNEVLLIDEWLRMIKNFFQGLVNGYFFRQGSQEVYGNARSRYNVLGTRPS